MTRPPFLITSGSLARLVASTLMNGYSTAAMTTTKTQILTVFSKTVSCSSQAGRSLAVPRATPAPASITSTRLPGPCPARRACDGSASHGGSRVHAFLAHAQLEELATAPHRMAAHE